MTAVVMVDKIASVFLHTRANIINTQIANGLKFIRLFASV